MIVLSLQESRCIIQISKANDQVPFYETRRTGEVFARTISTPENLNGRTNVESWEVLSVILSRIELRELGELREELKEWEELREK